MQALMEVTAGGCGQVGQVNGQDELWLRVEEGAMGPHTTLLQDQLRREGCSQDLVPEASRD